MRKVTPCLMFSLICLSCKKEIKEVVVVIPYAPTSIQVKIDQVINDSTIVLKWSTFAGNTFQKYRLVRTATYWRNGQFGC